MNNDRNIICFELADSEFSTFYSLLVSVELRKDRKELTLAFYHFGVQVIGERLKTLADGILDGKIGKVGTGKCDGDDMRPESQYTVTVSPDVRRYFQHTCQRRISSGSSAEQHQVPNGHRPGAVSSSATRSAS